jgi:glutathione S-transferase
LCFPRLCPAHPPPLPQVLADGTLLNEGAAALQWIADQAPESGLAPANGTSARYLLQAKLNYLASEVHASFGPLFNPALTGEARAAQVEKLNTKLKWVEEKELANGEKKFILGDAFTVADAYFYIITTWAGYVGLELSKGVQAYRDNIAAIDFVKEAHAAMAAASPKKA